MRYQVEQWTKTGWVLIGRFETLEDARAVGEQAAHAFLGVRLIDTRTGARIWAVMRGEAIWS